MLGQYLADSLPTKRVRYSGIECTVLKIPDMPNGIQPAFCRVDGMLHLAESALSLRALLKVQDKVTVAMDVGDAPLPLVAGDVLTIESSKVRSKPKPKSPAESIPAGISFATIESVTESPTPAWPAVPRPEKSIVR